MSTTSVTSELISRPANPSLCLLLAKAFSSPQHFERGLPRSCREMAAGLPSPLAENGLSLAEEWDRARQDPESVLLAYAKLFVGPFEIQASPYASHYLEPDHRLMGDVSMWVAEAYAGSSLGPAQGPAEAPDHVALEWEFLYFLGYQAITLEEPEWSDRAQWFIETHMSHWIPQLAGAILASDTHPFYHALARFAPLFLQFIGAESEFLPAKDQE